MKCRGRRSSNDAREFFGREREIGVVREDWEVFREALDVAHDS